MKDASPELIQSTELLVVGGPTHIRGITSALSRKMGMKEEQKDLPQALQDRGGWENRDSADWFADYAMVVFTALGDRVDRWLTINDAKIIAQEGYQYGRMAPGKSIRMLREP